MRLRFNDHDAQMVGLGIFVEAGLPFQPLGANEIDVPDLDALDDEQRGELATLVRDPLETAAVHPPVAVDGTSPAVGQVGETPPRSGQGATRDAWAAYADKLNAARQHAGLEPVVVTPEMGRDEIIQAVDEAVEAT